MQKKISQKYIIGIDEVGRGPIAGPVAVGVFVAWSREDIDRVFPGVKESKQLSEKKREEWFAKIEEAVEKGKVQKSQTEKSHDSIFLDFEVAFQSEKSIDKDGISYCIKKCMEDALGRLLERIGDPDFDNFYILLDGGLKAPAHFKNQETIIRGDAEIPLIALASIAAKVLRDREMRKLSEKHPNYGFDVHKGYGTKAHYTAIQKHGLTPIHRRSFCKTLAKNGHLR